MGFRIDGNDNDPRLNRGFNNAENNGRKPNYDIGQRLAKSTRSDGTPPSLSGTPIDPPTPMPDPPAPEPVYAPPVTPQPTDEPITQPTPIPEPPASEPVYAPPVTPQPTDEPITQPPSDEPIEPLVPPTAPPAETDYNIDCAIPTDSPSVETGIDSASNGNTNINARKGIFKAGAKVPEGYELISISGQKVQGDIVSKDGIYILRKKH